MRGLSLRCSQLCCNTHNPSRAYERVFSFGRQGTISHQQAEEKAVAEYEKFRIIQDREIMSDFDQQLKLLLNGQ